MRIATEKMAVVTGKKRRGNHPLCRGSGEKGLEDQSQRARRARRGRVNPKGRCLSDERPARAQGHRQLLHPRLHRQIHRAAHRRPGAGCRSSRRYGPQLREAQQAYHAGGGAPEGLQEAGHEGRRPRKDSAQLPGCGRGAVRPPRARPGHGQRALPGGGGGFHHRPSADLPERLPAGTR